MQELFYDIGGWLETAGAWAYLIAPTLGAGAAVAGCRLSRGPECCSAGAG